MKKLANSRISKVTKSFEEKLLQKDKEAEVVELLNEKICIVFNF